MLGAVIDTHVKRLNIKNIKLYVFVLQKRSARNNKDNGIALNMFFAVGAVTDDIIFLSDIRLCNKNLILASNDCSKIFMVNPYSSYKFVFQSSRNKRGVGILFKNAISISEEARVSDPDNNFLLLHVTFKGTTMI